MPGLNDDDVCRKIWIMWLWGNVKLKCVLSVFKPAINKSEFLNGRKSSLCCSVSCCKKHWTWSTGAEERVSQGIREKIIAQNTENKDYKSISKHDVLWPQLHRLFRHSRSTCFLQKKSWWQIIQMDHLNGNLDELQDTAGPEHHQLQMERPRRTPHSSLKREKKAPERLSSFNVWFIFFHCQ